MIDKVKETINKYNLIQHGDKIVVGVSGGADSICLLHILYTLSIELNLTIFAVHINHMLRGDESDKDELYVQKICKSLRIDFYSKAYDIYKISMEDKISQEEAGRVVRYNAFEEVLRKNCANKIAVAHNRNDQGETILLNIIRGTGLEGLKGIDIKRGKIIRPLLEIDRTEIEKYCEIQNLEPRTDSSNLKKIYTRNKIRLELIPQINKLFDIDVNKSLIKMSNLIRDDNDYLQYIVEKGLKQAILKKENGCIWANIPEIAKNHISLKRRIIRGIIEKVKGDLKGIESKHIESIIDLINKGKTGLEIHITKLLRAEISYNNLKVYMKNEEVVLEDLEQELNVPGETIIDNIGTKIKIEAFKKEKEAKEYLDLPYLSTTQFFDYELLKSGINIRSRKSGDYFKPYKSTGTKKLKDYFIDNKVPREIRDKILLIAKKNEIVWIIGYKISDKFKVTENTKYVLKVEWVE